MNEPEQRARLLLASGGYTELVAAAFQSGDQWLAVYSVFYALNLAERTAPSPQLAEAYGPVGMFYAAIPWRSATKRYQERALDTARQVDSPSATGYTLFGRGVYEVGAAGWDTVQVMSDELLDLGRRVGSRQFLSNGLQLRTALSYARGNFKECVAAGDELLGSATRGRDPRFTAYGFYAKAYGALYLGQPDEALALLGEIPDLLESETTDRQLNLMYFALLSAVYLRLGRAHEGFDAAVAAQERQAGPVLDLGYSCPGYALTAEVLLELWKSQHPDSNLPKRARQACQALTRFARLYEAGRPCARLCQGSYAWLTGKPGWLRVAGVPP